MYKTSRWDCDDFYRGKRKCQLHDRKTEHFKALTKSCHTSAIVDHITPIIGQSDTQHKVTMSYYYSSPPGWDASPSQDTQHKVTMSYYYSSPPGWDASPSQDTQHKVTMSYYYSSPPGWDASSLQDTQHKVTWSITTPSWMGYLTITGNQFSIKWLGELLVPLNRM